METSTYTPRVMYHPSGQTRRVDDAQTEKALLGSEWGFKPFPAEPEAPKRPSGIQGQLEDLHDRVLVLEAILMKRKGAKKDE